jgi:hypothetical protein
MYVLIVVDIGTPSPPYVKWSSASLIKPRDTFTTKKNKLHGLSPQANYTDRATAACRRSDCQLVRIEGATWSAWRIPPAVFLVF